MFFFLVTGHWVKLINHSCRFGALILTEIMASGKNVARDRVGGLILVSNNYPPCPQRLTLLDAAKHFVHQVCLFLPSAGLWLMLQSAGKFADSVLFA